VAPTRVNGANGTERWRAGAARPNGEIKAVVLHGRIEQLLGTRLSRWISFVMNSSSWAARLNAAGPTMSRGRSRARTGGCGSAPPAPRRFTRGHGGFLPEARGPVEQHVVRGPRRGLRVGFPPTAMPEHFFEFPLADVIKASRRRPQTVFPVGQRRSASPFLEGWPNGDRATRRRCGRRAGSAELHAPGSGRKRSRWPDSRRPRLFRSRPCAGEEMAGSRLAF